MAYVDELKRVGYEGGVYFVGAFDSGAEVRWATRAVAVTGTLPGLAEERLLSFPSIEYGLGETWDAELQIPGCTLELDNSDGELTPYLLGCDPDVSAVTEYTGDSFLNLSGILYHFVVRDGVVTTRQISGNLYCERGVSATDTRITLRLSAKGGADLTRNRFGTITVRHLLDSTAGGYASGSVSSQSYLWADRDSPRELPLEPNDLGATITQGEFTTLLSEVAAGEDVDTERPVPFLFGRSWFQPVAIGTRPRQQQACFSILGVTVTQSDLGAIQEWRAADKDGKEFGKEGRLRNRPYAVAQVGQIRRDVLCDDGTTRAVWIVFGMLSTRLDRDSGGYEWQAVPPDLLLPSSRATVGGVESTPAGIVEGILEDLAPTTLAVTTADFTRAKALQLPKQGGAWGGSVHGDADLDGPVATVAGAGHLGVWLDRTGSVRCLAYPGWGADEVAAAAGSLPQIRASDVLSEVEETLPVGENERGSAVSTISMEWTDEQRNAIPPRWRMDKMLGGYVPGVRGFPIEGTLRGDWIEPMSGARVLRAAAQHRNRFARRVSLTTRLWVGAAYDIAQLFRLSVPMGRGGAGYEDRLVRLEHVSLDFGQDAAVCRFEDLGAIEDLRSVVLDDEDNWVRHNPSGTGISLALSSVSTTVTASGGTPFASVIAGDHLWTFGSANETNRVCKRITSKTSSTQVVVESVYAVTEAALAASAGGTGTIDASWIVMKSQGSMSPTNITKLTVCSEVTNLFRDGTTAGFVCSG